jgi:hypothetical protein
MLLGAINGRVRRVIGAILLVVALLMTAGAILATVTSLNLRANGVKTNATILNVQTNFSRHSASTHTYTYTDLIQFTTPDGKQHQASIGGGRGDRVGGTVAVVYDPSDPGTVQTASSLGSLWWITPVALLLFALLFGWLGRRMWRTRPAAEPERDDADNVSGNLF